MTLLEMRIAWIVLPYLLLILSLSIPLVSVGCVCAHNFKMCALLFIKYFTDLCIYSLSFKANYTFSLGIFLSCALSVTVLTLWVAVILLKSFTIYYMS